ncbi:MAG TPA: hypothetical protein VIJ86_12165 [Acidimicrobiales bacterium]
MNNVLMTWRADARQMKTRWVAIAALVAGLTIATVGFPSFLLVAGAWSFAALTNRWVKVLAGPASWAVGIIVEAVIVLAQSAILAILLPHPDPQWVDVAMLLVPLIVALGIEWRMTLRSPGPIEREQFRPSAEPYLAVVCVVLIEAMFEAIKLHGHDFGLTWFMGGDGRNHVVADRSILHAGGITLKEMSSYPALFNALAAVVDGAGGRVGISSGVLLVRDVQAMTAMVILSCVGIALCFIAAVVETFARNEHSRRRLPLYLWIPLGACGSIAIGAFVLSLAASGGFFSAMGCLAFALASLVVGLRIVQHYSHAALIVLTFALVLVVGSWTFLVVVPAVALVAGYVSGIRYVRQRAPGHLRETRISLSVMGISALCLLGVVGVLVTQRATLLAQVRLTGGIVGPNPRLFDWLGVVIVVAVALAPNARQRVARLVLLAEFVVLFVTVSRIQSVHPGGVDWSYYATKTIWLATAMLLWVPFVVLLDVMRIVTRFLRAVGWRVVANATMAVAGSSGVLWGIGHETPFTFPLAWAWFGSTIPSPQEIQLVTHEAALGAPFVIWDYSTAFQDELGNYWSALTWDYRPNGTEKAAQGVISFVNWSASENGTSTALCEITSEYRLRIVTLNRQLVSTLKKTCPGYLPAPPST